MPPGPRPTASPSARADASREGAAGRRSLPRLLQCRTRRGACGCSARPLPPSFAACTSALRKWIPAQIRASTTSFVTIREPLEEPLLTLFVGPRESAAHEIERSRHLVRPEERGEGVHAGTGLGRRAGHVIWIRRRDQRRPDSADRCRADRGRRERQRRVEQRVQFGSTSVSALPSVSPCWIAVMGRQNL